ncbi:hypothetical protein [Nocardioides sp. J54]|uniref:hypothetical protein n=1 Tax=Nocardioides sp. J54 TaxID=935866 RepID=UPI0004BB45B6|nr:hypothetical protein [Nocardioides sp. J54]
MTILSTPTATGTRSALGRIRLWFGADALVTGANALAYLVAAGPITDLLGGDAGTVRAIGAVLVGYALLVALYTRSRLATGPGWAIVAANAVWVVASLEVALTGALGLDGPGRAWVVVQALVVADLAVLQARALRAR